MFGGGADDADAAVRFPLPDLPAPDPITASSMPV